LECRHPVLTAAAVAETLQCPVFVDGEDFAEFRRTRRAAITSRSLLFGALVAAGEQAPLVDMAAFRAHLPKLLEVFRRGFEFESVDEMFTSVAAALRRDHGSALSRRALQNALDFYPASNRTRSDLIADLWVLAVETNPEERSHLLLLILKHFRKLDRRDLDARPRAFVCYAAVVAYGFARPGEAARHATELAPEIAEGDEGQLAKRLERFLFGPPDWSLVAGVNLASEREGA
jgi:hypothetical protein